MCFEDELSVCRARQPDILRLVNKRIVFESQLYDPRGVANRERPLKSRCSLLYE